jgi:hypothetical protein
MVHPKLREGANLSQSRSEKARHARLVRVIEGEIVPRLMMSRAAAATSAPSADVAELARLLLVHEGEIASEFVHMLRQHGALPERICLELLAPTARRLGELWARDACDFAELTTGLNRLQAVLLEVSAERH